MKVVGKSENSDIPALGETMNSRWQDLENVIDAEMRCRVCGPLNEGGNFAYLAGQEASQTDDLPSGMEILEVPGQTYAVFPCTIPTISGTYENTFKTWMAGS